MSSAAGYDLPFATSGPADAEGALVANSFVILRGAIAPRKLTAFLAGVQAAMMTWHRGGAALLEDPATIAALSRYPLAPGISRDVAGYATMAADGYLSDAMLRFATDDRQSFFDLIAEPRLWAMFAALAHGSPIDASVMCHSRAMHARGAVGPGADCVWTPQLGFHYDYFFHREQRFGLNVWCPFAAVGARARTPSLLMLRAPLADTIAALLEGDEPVALDPEVHSVPGLSARFGAANLIPLELDLGDVVVFTNWTLHRTYYPDVTEFGRTSAEIRMSIGGGALEHYRRRAPARAPLWRRALSATGLGRRSLAAGS